MRLIDADLLFDKLEQRYSRSSGWVHKAFGTAIDDVADSPTVDAVEVVHGHWGKYEVFEWAASLNGYPCRACGKRVSTKTNYCPNCGAKMDGVSDG